MTTAARRRIYLMRHAQVRYFEGVEPRLVLLTEEGRRQAAAARDALQEVRFDRVVTSGLPRTLETAEIVAPHAPPEDEPAFRGTVPLSLPFLGGETIGELFARVLPALDRLLAADGWDVALLVLHGGVNRAILGRALTGDRVFLGNFEQAPGCINVLDVDGVGNFIVRAVNHTPYDPSHAAAARETTMEQLWREYLDARSRRS